jgi:hypothetical protein
MCSRCHQLAITDIRLAHLIKVWNSLRTDQIIAVVEIIGPSNVVKAPSGQEAFAQVSNKS